MKEDLNNIINLIESQIRNGNISKGLDIIAAEFKKINTYKSKKLAEQAEMLISRLGYLRSNIREGVIAQSEINLEHNKIVQSTIGLKQKLKVIRISVLKINLFIILYYLIYAKVNNILFFPLFHDYKP